MAEVELSYAEFQTVIRESFERGWAEALATASSEIERLEAEIDALREQGDG